MSGMKFAAWKGGGSKATGSATANQIKLSLCEQPLSLTVKNYGVNSILCLYNKHKFRKVGMEQQYACHSGDTTE